jgi:glycosyltransferase involved in cell wall biosynthesis
MDFKAKHIIIDESGRVARKMYGWLRKSSGKLWYSPRSLSAEIKVLQGSLLRRKAFYHFIYGEVGFRYAGLAKKVNKNIKIISTYHQPPHVFTEIVRNTKHLNDLDAIIIVGKNQSGYFENLVGKNKVYFVPHGINTDFFVPKIHPGKSLNDGICLFVGQWLRDFQTLKKVIEIIYSINDKIKCEIVIPANRADEFKGIGNIDIQSNVSDEALLAAYQRADLLLLPILDCTANNSILEAMATGLPIITNDVGGIRDYVDENCALLSPEGDAEGMVKNILLLMQDANLRKRMGEAARLKAVKEFDWKIVAKKTLEIYRTIDNNK